MPPHTYAEEGTYAYSVTVTDDGGAVTIFSGSAIIADASLAPSATQPTVTTTEPTIFPVPVFSPPLFKGPVALVHRRQPDLDHRATSRPPSTGATAPR